MLLITNNPRAFKEAQKIKNSRLIIEFLETDYIGVLEKARDLVHQNYSILTHPLYGSVKPNETVYRTLILEEGNEIDFTSINLIEEAVTTANTFMRNHKPLEWPDSILDDFQVIDWDLIENTYYRIV